MRMIFVNLPVADLQASTAFYTALGFTKNPDFSDDTATCMVVSEQIYVMLLTHDKFRMFINGDISDSKTTKEVLNCLSASTRDEVDAFKAKALAAGGTEWKPNMEMGPMYGCSFQDLDSHVWEIMYMDMSGG
ncbi:VOC family protein [Rhizobium sp.]|uniref:VOC family protein n=1 Tax=Rhizobium sp. TaxID=391 RepID=UPI0028A6661D